MSAEPADILKFAARGPAQSPTVAEVISLYLDYRQLQAQGGMICPEILARNRRLLGLFASHFNKPVSECRQTDLTSFLILYPQWESPDAKTMAVGCVVTCFRWAEDERIIDRCPYRRPKGLIPPPEPRNAIKPEEVRALLASARTKGFRKTRRAFRLLIWFLWRTGCRTCEAREVLWSELDWDAGVIRHEKHKTRRKTGTARLIPLTDDVLRLLGWLARHGGTNGTIFKNGRGRPWTRGMLVKNFRAYADRAGIRAEVSAYCLRHGFCVQGLDAGVGNRQIADVLGQASTRYVDWYGKQAKSKTDYLRKNAAMINRGPEKAS